MGDGIMKKTKIFGIAILILAIVVAGVGVAADLAKKGDGTFASRLAEARAAVETVNANAKAVKNVAAMDKKIAAAETKLDEAAEAARQALDGANALDAAIASGASGDADVDALRAALEKLGEGSAAARAFEKTFNLDSAALSEALDGVDGGVADLTALADEKELALYQALVDDSFAAVSGAESAVDGARESAEKIWSLIGQSAELEAATVTGQPECADVDACRAALQSLLARAEEMDAYRAQMDQWRKEADAAAAESSKASVSAMDRMVIALADNFIGVLFTAALLLILALVMLFLSDAFRRQWTKNPVFSVGMALIVMLIFQTYALGFGQGSVGAWAKFWFDNTFNVLRANTSVGMIALFGAIGLSAYSYYAVILSLMLILVLKRGLINPLLGAKQLLSYVEDAQKTVLTDKLFLQLCHVSHEYRRLLSRAQEEQNPRRKTKKRRTAQKVVCPVCGTENAPAAAQCARCGEILTKRR